MTTDQQPWTDLDVEPPSPPPRGSGPVPKHPCFSGDGRMTRGTWAPGGDTRYRERLRRAFRAGKRVPDPWFIADHGGIELPWPDGGWPTLSPWEVAERLDAERVERDPYVDPMHWRNWLEFTERRMRARAERKASTSATYEAMRAEQTEDALAQARRPQRDATGTAYVDPEQPEDVHPARVVELADPKRMIVELLDMPEHSVTRRALIYDEMFTPDMPTGVNTSDEGNE